MKKRTWELKGLDAAVVLEVLTQSGQAFRQKPSDRVRFDSCPAARESDSSIVLSSNKRALLSHGVDQLPTRGTLDVKLKIKTV